MKKYFKWIDKNKPTIRGIPGFVWASVEDAIEMKEEIRGWIKGDLYLYSMDGPNPTMINILFSSSLCSKQSSKPLGSEEAMQVKKYFESKPSDFFHLATSTKNDRELFLRLAATFGVLQSTVPNWDQGVLEVYIGIPLTMQLLSDIEKISETL